MKIGVKNYIEEIFIKIQRNTLSGIFGGIAYCVNFIEGILYSEGFNSVIQKTEDGKFSFILCKRDMENVLILGAMNTRDLFLGEPTIGAIEEIDSVAILNNVLIEKENRCLIK